MEQHITLQSLNGATVHLSRDGKKVVVRIQTGTKWIKGDLAAVEGDTLRLTTGATVQLSAPDAALALAYQQEALQAPARLSLVMIIVIIVLGIIGVRAIYAGVQGGMEAMNAELASDAASSQ